MKKQVFLMFSLTLISSCALEAGRGGAIAGGVLGGMALGAMINQASQPQAIYVEREPVYYQSAPVYYESSPTYYEEYIDDGYDSRAEINRHINMHQRDNVLERTNLQREAQSTISAREQELDRREQAIAQREAALSSAAPDYENDRESVYEDPFEEFNTK
jgi:hypothetical protein